MEDEYYAFNDGGEALEHIKRFRDMPLGDWLKRWVQTPSQAAPKLMNAPEGFDIQRARERHIPFRDTTGTLYQSDIVPPQLIPPTLTEHEPIVDTSGDEPSDSLYALNERMLDRQRRLDSAHGEFPGEYLPSTIATPPPRSHPLRKPPLPRIPHMVGDPRPRPRQAPARGGAVEPEPNTPQTSGYGVSDVLNSLKKGWDWWDSKFPARRQADAVESPMREPSSQPANLLPPIPSSVDKQSQRLLAMRVMREFFPGVPAIKILQDPGLFAQLDELMRTQYWLSKQDKRAPTFYGPIQ